MGRLCFSNGFMRHKTSIVNWIKKKIIESDISSIFPRVLVLLGQEKSPMDPGTLSLIDDIGLKGCTNDF